MEAEHRRAAKEQMIALMQAGHRWQEASAQAGIQVSCSTAYRLLRQALTRGKAAFPDGRHGPPAKLRTAERVWLENYCMDYPHRNPREASTSYLFKEWSERQCGTCALAGDACVPAREPEAGYG